MAECIDLIFKGRHDEVDIRQLLSNLGYNKARARFNTPEISTPNSLDELIDEFKKHEYIDFILELDMLCDVQLTLPNVFCNLSIDGLSLELLLFFDVQDVSPGSMKNNIDLLMAWSSVFNSKYGFRYTRCQMDNGTEQEYFFDSNGLGPLYHGI